MIEKSEKSYLVAVCLSACFGIIGIQHFYLGRWLLGIVDLGLSICVLVSFIHGHFIIAGIFFAADFLHTTVVTIMLLTGTFADGQGRIVAYPGQNLNI